MFPVREKNFINASCYYRSSSYGIMKIMKSKYLHFKKNPYFIKPEENLLSSWWKYGERRDVCLELIASTEGLRNLVDYLNS